MKVRIRDITVDALPLRGRRIEFGPGLTVVRGGNEAGKTTLTRALQGALESQRASKHRATLEIGDEVVSVPDRKGPARRLRPVLPTLVTVEEHDVALADRKELLPKIDAELGGGVDFRRALDGVFEAAGMTAGKRDWSTAVQAEVQADRDRERRARAAAVPACRLAEVEARRTEADARLRTLESQALGQARKIWDRFRALDAEVEERYGRAKREDVEEWRRAEDALTRPPVEAPIDFQAWEAKWRDGCLQAARAVERRQDAAASAARRPAAIVLCGLFTLLGCASLAWSFWVEWWGSVFGMVVAALAVFFYFGRIREARFYGQAWLDAKGNLTRLIADWRLTGIPLDDPEAIYRRIGDLYEPTKREFQQRAEAPDRGPAMTPAEAKQRIEQLRDRTGAATREALEERVAERERKERDRDQSAAQVAALLGTDDRLQWRMRLADVAPSDAAGTASAQAQAAREDWRRWEGEAARLRGELAAVGASSPPEVFAQADAARQRLRNRTADRAAAILAASALERIRDAHRGSIEDALGEAGSLLGRLTQGRYTAVAREGDDFAVTASDGTRLRSEQISGGARMQLYLALRIAIVSRLFAPDPGLLILDDALMTFDAERRAAAWRVLEELAAAGWQIVYLSFDPPATAGVNL